MAPRNKIADLLIDTLIVFAGFAVAIYAAGIILLTKDFSNLAIFLVGFVLVCIGLGRRLTNYWEK